jgi:hypothetical protein
MVEKTKGRHERRPRHREVAETADKTGNHTPGAGAAGIAERSRSPNGPERHARIAEAAYYSAERRGFQGNRALDDWLEAERAIDSRATAAGFAAQASVSRGERTSAAPRDGGQTRNAGPVAETIEPDRVGTWARKLKVPAPRLREAIQRVGPLVNDVKEYLRTAS